MNIENCLARDSLEGIARYRFGISPKSMPFHKQVLCTVRDHTKLRGLRVIPLPPDKQSKANEIKPISQVGIFNTTSGFYNYYSLEEIPTREELEKQGFRLGRIEIVFYGDVEALVAKLKENGLNVEFDKINECPQQQEPRKIPVLVKTKIDRTIYRGLCKIAFNYLAHNLGAEIALKKDFDGIRRFIRYDEGKADDFFQISKIPIFSRERRLGKRWHPGHIVVIGWEGYSLIGRLAIFNSIVGLTYRVTLCNNYQGVWLPFSKAHYFEPRSKKIIEVQNLKFLIYR
jgi:hypothetical protein